MKNYQAALQGSKAKSRVIRYAQLLTAKIHDMVYTGIHLTLNSDKKLLNYTLIITVIFWTQLIALFFTSESYANWNFDSVARAMSKGADILLIAPAIRKLGFEAYTVANTCALLIIILAWLLLFYLARKDRVSNYKFNSVYGLHRAFVYAMITIMIIPIVLTLLTAFSCERDYNGMAILRYFEERECLKGLNILNILFSIIGFVLYFIYLVVNGLFMIETRMSINIGLAAAPSYFQLHIIIYAAGCSILSSISNIAYNTEILLLGYITYLPVLYIYYFKNNPYYNPYMERLTKAMFLILVWTVLLYSISFAGKESLGSEGLIAWLIGLPFLLFIPILFGYKTIRLLSLNYNSLKDPNALEAELQYMITIWLRYYHEKRARLLFGGCLELHRYNCKFNNCPIVNVPVKDPEALEEYRIMNEALIDSEFKDYIVLIFNEIVKKFETDVSLRIKYIFFLADKIKNKALIANQLEVVAKLRPDFQERFILYRYRNILEDIIAEKDDQNILNINIQDHLYNEAYNKRLADTLMKTIEMSVTFYIDFWKQLFRENIDIYKLKNVGTRISNLQIDLNRQWERIANLDIKNFPNLMIIYGRYLCQISNDTVKGEDLIFDGQKLIEIEIAKKKDLNHLEVTDDIGNTMIPLVMISGKPKQLGTILNINVPCCSIFGYQKKELVGKNINLLMPDFIANLHNKYLENAIKKKKTNLFKNNKLIFGRHASDILIPIHLQVKALLGSNPLFMGTVQVLNKNKTEAHILITEKGEIIGITNGCYTLLGLNIDKLEQKCDFNYYFPGLMKQFDQYTGEIATEVNSKYFSLDVISHTKNQKLYLQTSTVQYKKLKKLVYVFKFVNDKPEHDSTKQSRAENVKPSLFELKYNRKNKKVVATEKAGRFNNNAIVEGDSIVASDSEKYSQKKDHELNWVNYGDQIKTMRLEAGELVNIQENLTEESKINNKQAKKTDSYSDVSEHKMSNEINRSTENEEQNFDKVKYVRAQLRTLKVPRFVKVYVILSHFLIILVLGTVITDYVLKNKTARLVKNYITVFDHSMQQESEIQNIVTELTLIAAKNHAPTLPIDMDVSLDLLTRSINKMEGLDKQLADSARSLVNTVVYDHLFVKRVSPNDRLSDNGENKVTLTAGRRNIVTAAFSLINNSLKNINLNNSNLMLVIISAMNNIKILGRQAANHMIDSIITEIGHWRLYIIVQCCFIVIALIGTFVIINFQKKYNAYTKRIMNRFIMLSDKKIRNLASKCENFLDFMRSEKEDNKLLSEKDIRCLEQLDYKEKKKEGAKVKKRFNHSFALNKLRIFVFVGMFILGQCVYFSTFYIYKHSMDRLGEYVREFNVTKTIYSEYSFFQNSLSYSALSGTVTTEVLNQDFETYTNSTIPGIFLLDSSLYEWRNRNADRYSSEYNELNRKLFFDSLCDFVGNYTDTRSEGNPRPDAEDCNLLTENQLTYSYVGSGLLVAFSYYQQNLRNMALQFIEYSKSNRRAQVPIISPNCTVNDSMKSMCLFENDKFLSAYNFQTNYFKYFYTLWSAELLHEINSFSNSYIFNIHLYFLLAFLGVGFLMYFTFFMQFVLINIRNIKKLENMLLMLPLEQMSSLEYTELLNMDK